MGQQQAKEKLFQAVEMDNVKECIQILKQFPELLDECLVGAHSPTPLQRSCWRGNIDMVLTLIELGAAVDKGDVDGITPLMWAAKRDHAELCVILIRTHADLVKRRSLEGLSALDYAILHGNYSCAYMIHEFEGELQSVDSYALMGKVKHWRWVNYEKMVGDLESGVTIQNAGNYFDQPQRVLMDPVVDPRESWAVMIKRIMNFELPPMVEREDLPHELQPQNRMWGRMSSYVHGRLNSEQ